MFTYTGKALRDGTLILMGGKSIDLEGEFEEFTLLDDDFNNYDIFIAGEAHGNNLSYEMQKYLSRYFIENHDVRYIVLEGSPANAELLNQYLITGEDEELKVVMDNFKGSPAYSEDNYQLYKFYYEYNKELPNNKKIRFIGVDIEQSIKNVAEYTKLLIKKAGDTPPQNIERLIKKINGNAWVGNKSIILELQESMKNNKEEFIEYFGENFFYFYLAIKNAFRSFNNTEREEAMVENFKSYYEKLDKGKYFGQFGAAHVWKMEREEWTYGEGAISTFANSLNEDYEPLKDKVCSIVYEYMNSKINFNGDIIDAGEINIPYFKGKGCVILYTPEDDKLTYDIFEKNHWQREKLGDMFFLIKDSPGASKYIGE